MKSVRNAIAGGLAGLALLVTTACYEMEKYGCEAKADVEQEGNAYDIEVGCRHYLNPTGIKVRDGDVLDVSAEGECCWDRDYICAGPEGTSSAWGLYWMFRKEGSDVGYDYDLLGSGFSGEVMLPDDDEYELVLVIPEGSNKEICFPEAYKTNKGSYDVLIEKMEGE
jgi:hypothetical protein